MKINVPTYEQRRNKIKSINDINEQIKLAKAYAIRLRNKAKKATLFADKLAIHKKEKEALSLLRKLRFNSFAIEDELNAAA